MRKVHIFIDGYYKECLMSTQNPKFHTIKDGIIILHSKHLGDIDPFTTPPWNCVEGVTFPETVKGAGTWLMSEIVQEVINTEIVGVIKVLTIDRAKSFYLSMGFQENPDDEREMVLTREAARSFLSKYQIYKES